ncbi:hypothetical protein I6F31_05550 [Bradyrhizobium sp. NBAIM01]|nr:hypothetical protein [Bradyrhizobium sp. NBAIM01]
MAVAPRSKTVVRPELIGCASPRLILPLWARRTKSLSALLPVLCLRGIWTGDFQEALSARLGKDAPSVISRLKAQWQGEYER